MSLLLKKSLFFRREVTSSKTPPPTENVGNKWGQILIVYRGWVTSVCFCLKWGLQSFCLLSFCMLTKLLNLLWCQVGRYVQGHSLVTGVWFKGRTYRVQASWSEHGWKLFSKRLSPALFPHASALRRGNKKQMVLIQTPNPFVLLKYGLLFFVIYRHSRFARDYCYKQPLQLLQITESSIGTLFPQEKGFGHIYTLHLEN